MLRALNFRPAALRLHARPVARLSFFWKKGPDGGDKEDDKKQEAEGEGQNAVELVAGNDGAGALTKIGIGENAPKPPHLLAVPIQRRPLFPGFMAPLVLTDEALIEAMIALRKTTSPFVGVFMLKDPNVDLTVDKFQLTRTEQIHQVGTLAHIQQLEAGPGGAIAMLMAHRRVKILDIANVKTPPVIVRVQHLVQAPYEAIQNSDEVKATSNEILSTLRDIIRVNPLFQQHISYFARRVDVTNPYALADFAASLTTADAGELQDILETMELQDRLRKALLLLKKEQQLSQLQQTIKQDVEKRIDKQQRTFFLQEQLKSIKKELGLEKDDKDTLVSKFQERVSHLDMPESAKTVFQEEMEKLSILERNSSEFNVTRTYLDWLTSIPWGKYSQDNFDLGVAQKVLDEDHYGMTDVKDRILEFIAVGKLKGSVQGKILCLVGPPGVGKTSIGKSIAHALNRQFFRFSVGGLSDVAEIKGHRRTYIGAMPGKLIQCMKSTGVSNPLVLVDEIDKIGHGRGYSGDPASALLEMLDPNQNSSFMDHYLDTPIDASKVLFICTANTLDTIPGPLLDRMEVIRLSGYDAPEKMQIAKRYLDPKTRAEMGLKVGTPGTPDTLKLEDSAIEHMIRWYAREAGVRNLEKLIAKAYRKAAIQVVKAREAELAKANAEASQQTAAAAKPVEPPPTPISSSQQGTAAADPPKADDQAAQAAPQAAGGQATPPPPEPVIKVENEAWTITSDNLTEYIGHPIFTSDRLYDVAPPGVVMGLAWTSMGGSALYIEVVSPLIRAARKASKKGGYAKNIPLPADNDVIVNVVKQADDSPDTPNPDNGDGSRQTPDRAADEASRASGGHLRLTGKMGEVMQESAQIAYTMARRLLRSLPGQANNDYLDTMPLHMHVPEGATPKDGPSAGVTMATALLSVAMDKRVRPDIAMTGELTLTGKVLSVGGIKEKIMAARRANVKCVVIPAGCKKDYEELPDHLREGIEVHFAKQYEDVYKTAFEYDERLIGDEAARLKKEHPDNVAKDEGASGTREQDHTVIDQTHW